MAKKSGLKAAWKACKAKHARGQITKKGLKKCAFEQAFGKKRKSKFSLKPSNVDN